MDIKVDEFGLKYFDELPSGARLAELSDFYQDDKFILRKGYLVKSYYSGRYYTFRTNSKDSFRGMMPFMVDGRVYVFA